MSERSIHDPGQVIDKLMRLVRYRASEESRLTADLTSRLSAADSHFQEASAELTQRLTTELESSRAAYQELQEDIQDEYDAHHGEAEAEYQQKQVAANREYSRAVNDIEREYEDARWMVNSVYDKSAEDSPMHRYEIFRARTKKEREFLEVQAKELDALSMEATELMRRQRQGTEVSVQVADPSSSSSDELHELHVTSTEQVGVALSSLRKLWLPRQFRGIRPLVMALLAWAAALPAIGAIKGDPMLVFNNPSDPESMAAAGMAAGVGLTFCLILYGIARVKSMKQFGALREHAITAANARREWLKAARKETETLRAAAEQWAEEQKVHRRKALAKATNTKNSRLAEAEAALENEMQELSDRYTPELERITARRDRRLREANEKYPALNNSLDNRLGAQQTLLTRNHEQDRQTIQTELGEEWSEMQDLWTRGFAEFVGGEKQIREWVDSNFPGWEQLTQSWTPPKDPMEHIPVGRFDVNIADAEGGLPADDRLAVTPTRFDVPAMLRFPDEMSMVVRTGKGGRDEAVRLLQTAMLRLLTSLPPGKIRFTIIDPVGLGENFSAFMHLADYDEVIVTSRIWTEEQQINKRLLDLTEHMENVFQTYLRNEFGTIQEYNEQAGEVAEPYHFLVVANFPFAFSDDAAKRLTSIMSSGPRCGVHTLLTYDDRQEMPRGFQIEDLHKYATCLQWTDGRFVWDHDVYRRLPLTLDEPPGPGEFSQIVRHVGDESRDARHVEVAFDRIAPGPDALWSMDSRKGVDVPLGRAGATKLQHLRLGRGTSQHVMVAGKTGSGKSTLLHILITNLALYYSADEIEFYLIDFKKGVEFKTYAANRLPHARVVAIESDREFGLSVLQRLDAILQERGDLFRDRGVQDIAAFRDENPDSVMPRILLVIDEFQEFFVDDDQIGQKASLMLDRLVRQGRAFGIHVLLGSQTLGGAYSLPRSTMGQIAVRIALQCSEADSHLILSEENMAARLLSRPGEAIYNDANGTVEGNHPFQIAWLDDERRERFLRRIVDERHAGEVRPTVVFEGNVPAQPANNAALINTIRSRSAQAAPHMLRLWLGEPVAISDSTHVPFRRQSGHNLLIVGQNENLARGTLVMSAISAAAQVTPVAASPNEDVGRFYIFTAGERVEEDAIWTSLAEKLPHSIHQIDLRGTAAAVQEIRDEITRRDTDGLVDEPPIYVVIQGLSRFRDLRKDDDDFGFGGGFDSGDKPASCSKVFAEIIKEGPSLGVHTMTWCDTYSNTTRWLSTQSIREFELRVCFQMNATDSANVIDSPAASRLGPNRALLYVEELGAAEKFRPYGTAQEEWISQIAREIDGDIPEQEEEPTVEASASKSDVVTDLDGWTVE